MTCSVLLHETKWNVHFYCIEQNGMPTFHPLKLRMSQIRSTINKKNFNSTLLDFYRLAWNNVSSKWLWLVSVPSLDFEVSLVTSWNSMHPSSLACFLIFELTKGRKWRLVSQVRLLNISSLEALIIPQHVMIHSTLKTWRVFYSSPIVE